MTSAIKLLSVGGIITGGVGAGVTGTYYYSLETIEKQLKGKVLGDYNTFKSVWDHKYEELKKANEILKGVEDGKGMFLYCQKNYSSTYKTIFFKKENSELLKETKKRCTQTFKNQLSVVAEIGNNGKVLDVNSPTTDEATFKENYKALQDHQDKDGLLPKKLKDLAPKAKTESDSKWKELQSYCKGIQEEYITNETWDSFKVAKKYCIKAGTT